MFWHPEILDFLDSQKSSFLWDTSLNLILALGTAAAYWGGSELVNIIGRKMVPPPLSNPTQTPSSHPWLDPERELPPVNENKTKRMSDTESSTSDMGFPQFAISHDRPLKKPCYGKEDLFVQRK